jgi:protein-S-isoprenylcysteine O-methyltransferase
MDPGNVFSIAAACWGVSEIILGVKTRARSAAADVRDRGSLAIMWLTITASLVAGVAFRTLSATRIHFSSRRMFAICLILLITGAAIRWTAILTLGRWFTSNVAIGQGHRIIQTGLYGYIRHPSYTGMLLAFAALAFAQQNWFSITIIMVPITAAVLYRIRVEEAALIEAFGKDYLNYCKSTRRLVPGVY